MVESNPNSAVVLRSSAGLLVPIITCAINASDGNKGTSPARKKLFVFERKCIIKTTVEPTRALSVNSIKAYLKLFKFITKPNL